MANWKHPARAAQLKKLWSEGHSCSTIAAMIGGVTRNAVIGAVSRAKLPQRGHCGGGSRKQKLRPKPKAVRTPPISPVRAILCDGLPIPTPAETDIARVATVDLEPHHCRWPCVPDTRAVSPFEPIFCGKEKAKGLVYCRAHAARAYNMPEARRLGLPMPAIRSREVANA